MRIALQDGPVHVSAGIPFVGIADHDLFRVLDASRQPPLSSGWKSRAASSSQSREFHFVDDFAGIELQGFCKSRISAVINVIVNVFGVDTPAFFHDNPFFPVKPGKLGDRGNQFVFNRGAVNMFESGIAAAQKELDQHLGFSRRDFMIENRRESGVRMIDDHHRLCITMAKTSYGMDHRLDVVFSKGFFKGFLGLDGAGSDAAGGHADVNLGNRRVLKSHPAFPGCFTDVFVFLVNNIMTVGTHLFAFLFRPSLFVIESAKEVLRPCWAPYARGPSHR